MTYILIYVFAVNYRLTSGTVEFNNKESCLVAAKEISRQFHAREGLNPAVMTCVGKGVK